MKTTTRNLLRRIEQVLQAGLHEGLSDLTVQTMLTEVKEELTNSHGYFNITCVHRFDLMNCGLVVGEVTDEQMERLAGKMADDYCEQLFHIQLPIISDGLGIDAKPVKDVVESVRNQIVVLLDTVIDGDLRTILAHHQKMMEGVWIDLDNDAELEIAHVQLMQGVVSTLKERMAMDDSAGLVVTLGRIIEYMNFNLTK